MMYRTAWMGLAFAVTLGAAAEARADVTILGLRSLEGDEVLAERLTGYVRDFVTSRSLDQVSDKTQTLEQMTLLADCGDDVDQRCMREVAEMLGADDIVYGFISRMPGEGGHFTYAIDVRRFSAGSRRDVRSASGSLESSRQGTANLQILANTLIDELWEQRAETTLIVQSNEPDAAVYVDDDLVGRTGAEPLWVTDVSPGEHEVRVVKEGLEPWERMVDVARNQYRLLEAPLGGGTVAVGPAVGPGPGPGPGPGIGPGPGDDQDGGLLADWRLWTGAGLLAAGVGMAAGGLVYSLKASDLNDAALVNPDYIHYQTMAGSGGDTCDAAAGDTTDPERAARVTSICDENTNYLILQGVLYGLGAVAGGVGIYFLVDVLTDEEYDSDTAWVLTPTAFLGGGGLSLSGNF
ncbi:MAG: PEGA domain-containing protein [Deltaproteobacteria bacterium]|nr:PEGA domain-containing protein [Deltaproteobacteria bacterium]